MKVLEDTPAVLPLGKLCDENGYSYESKITSHFKTGFEYNATRRTSFLSWFQACQRVRPPVLISQLQGHLQDRRGIVLRLLQARLRHRQQHQVIMRLEKERIELKLTPLQCLCQLMLTIQRSNPLWTKPIKILKTHKKESKIERGNPLCADIPEWLQEFKENLVDDENARCGNPSQRNLETQLKKDHDWTGKPVWRFWDSGMAARIQGEFGGWWNSITGRLSRQFFSWSLFRADYKETWGSG